MDTQNKNLKLEIRKLEAEKSRLIEVLKQHKPSCAKQIQELMKTKEDEREIEFRVPLPPASTVTSRTVTTAIPALESPVQHQQANVVIPAVKITSPGEEEPPSFAEVEVKEELDSSGATGGGYNFDEYFSHNDAASFYPHHPTQVPFLGKRTLGHTYLDLDSRCIAL